MERSRLFQQVMDVLCTVTQKQPLLLILDDIQWADAASISLLFHLGRRLAGTNSRILIACAYRPEEVRLGRDGERHPLAQPLNEFKRTFGDVWIDLGQIGEAEGRSFIDALLNAEPNRLGQEFRNTLFHRTGSNPLFTIELLRAMQERGDLIKDQEGCWMEGPMLDWEAVPARVEAVIEERIDQLDPRLREVLNIASVEGEVFTAQVVAIVGNVTDWSTLHRLSQELERQHRLVREQEEVETNLRRISHYRFSHILFQDYLYKRLSPGERQLLHGKVAAALEKLYAGQLDDVSVQLAHHFFLAGDHENAFHYTTLAAERAARIYESRESITHYTRAIQLADNVCPDTVPLAQLHRGRGIAYERLGEFGRALNDYTTTQQMANAAGEREIEWRALVDLGKLWRARDYNQAHDCFEAALALARRMGDSKDLADSLNWMGNWCTNDEQPLRAVKYHREALNIAERLGDQQELANTLDLLGTANLVGGDLVTSVPYFNRAIAHFRELDDRPRLASSLLNRLTTASMQVLLASHSPLLPRDPLFDYQEALRIAKEIDSASDESWAHWSMSLLHSMRGQFESALQVVQSGLGIASGIGHREFLVGCHFALGILYTELFVPDQIQEQLESALPLSKELHSSPWIHLITGVLAGAYCLIGDLTLAQRCLDAVISDQTPMNTLGKRYCWARRAELALLQGDPTTALYITERLITSAPGMSSGRVITFLWKLKAEALIAVGRLQDAEPLLSSAIENARATGERFLLWRVYASLGRCQSNMGQLEAADQEFSSARALIEKLAATIPDEALKDSFLRGALNQIDANIVGGKNNVSHETGRS
jgi:tetratricopeptide (TPR) repeat protein